MKVSEAFTQSNRLHATYNFDLLEWEGLTIQEMKDVIDNAVSTFNGTGKLCFAFSNHDVPRSISRQIAPLNVKREDSKDLQLLLLKLESCLIGSTCIYQGEELAFEDVTDIPLEKMQDPWGVEFAATFPGRDTCRTPMVWDASAPNGGFSDANHTWLPIGKQHFNQAALGEVKKPDSIYSSFSEFLAWRRSQSAFMQANTMTKLSGSDRQIIFDRISEQQTLRCCFDFDTLTASFEEI
jgi:alpha-glucosidase